MLITKDGEILQEDIFSEEQMKNFVELIQSDSFGDIKFFTKLGYDMNPLHTVLSEIWEKYGIKLSENLSGKNLYEIKLPDGSFRKYPREIALGLVLTEMKYSGYNGNWTDITYTVNFIRKNIGSDIC